MKNQKTHPHRSPHGGVKQSEAVWHTPLAGWLAQSGKLTIDNFSAKVCNNFATQNFTTATICPTSA